VTISTDSDREVQLRGGITNAGLVTRVGDTVRRPWRPSTPAIQALLAHLERVGFDGAPRHLGIDERGREVLTYIPGEAVIAPYPDWALTDEALVTVADLVRRYHDAVVGFNAAGHRWPPPIPAHYRDGAVSHNDLNLDNIIFVAGRAVALIDFDLAGPGSTLWDVAGAARLWSPLRAGGDTPAGVRGRSLARLALFAGAYGLPRSQRGELAEAMVANHEWSYRIVSRAVAAGHEAFATYWGGGGGPRAERTRRWLAGHLGQMRHSLGVD
jgi:hypothetical protein